MKNEKTGKTVSVGLAHKIEQLTNSLKAEFGYDFAFTIMGKGHIIAASNYKYGIIKPSIRE